MADVDIKATREAWVGRVFQEFDLVVDGDRMLEWATACGETDPRFVDPQPSRLPGLDGVPHARERDADAPG